MKRAATKWILGLLAVPFIAGGCASSGTTDIAALEGRVGRLEKEVELAKRMASEAQRSAEAASLRADEAARTSEAIFARSVTK